jgi:signal transduction histidine kinase
MLEVIDDAINHADKIIVDLQEYSRDLQLEPIICSPQEILKDALKLIQVPPKVKIVDVTTETPIIKVDKTKIARLFINLTKMNMLDDWFNYLNCSCKDVIIC